MPVIDTKQPTKTTTISKADSPELLAQREKELREQAEKATQIQAGTDVETQKALAILAQVNPAEYAKQMEALKNESQKAETLADAVKVQVDYQTKINEWEKQISQADKLAKDPSYDVDTKQLDKAKQELSEIKADFEKTKEKVLQMTSPEIKPFITKDGGIQIDRALKMGVSEQALRDAGVRQIDIVKAKAEAKAVETSRKADIEVAKIQRETLQAKLDELKLIDEKAHAALQKGPDQYNKYIKDNYVEIKGAFISKEYIDEIKDTNPELHKMITTDGIEAASEYVNRQNRAIVEIQQTAPEAFTKDGVYLNVLISKGISEDKLRLAGFTQEQINRAKGGQSPDRLNEAARVTFGKDFNKLNVFQKAAAIEQAQNIQDFSPETMPTAVRLGVSMTPLMGTMYFWDEMDTTGKVISITGDVLFFTAPYILPKIIGGIKGVVSTSNLLKPLNQASAQTLKHLNKIAPKLVEPFKKVSTAQMQYADDLLRQAELKAVIGEGEKAIKGLTKGTTQYNIVDDLIKQSQTQLKQITSRLPTQKTDLKTAYEAWQSASGAEKQLTDIVRHTENVVKNIVEPTTAAKITGIQTKLTTAQKALNSVKTKYPTNPAKWADAAEDVARINSELKAAQLSNTMDLHRQLTAAQEVKPILQKLLAQTPESNPMYPAIKETLDKTNRLINTLPGEIDKNISALDVLWGRGEGISSRGGIAVTVPKGPVISGLGGATATDLTRLAARSTTWQAARLLGTVPVTTTKPTRIPDITPLKENEVFNPNIVTIPGTIPFTTTRRGAAVSPVTSTAPIIGAIPISEVTPISVTEAKETTGIEQQIEPAAEPAIEPVTSPATETKPATVTKTPTRTKSDVSAIRAVLKPVTKQPQTDSEKRAIIRDAGGAIAWRHGKLRGKDVWHVITKPYTSQENIYTLVGPTPKGATVVRGPRSAYKTAQVLRGKSIDRPVSVDVGFMDAKLKPISKNSLSISFQPDPNLQTKSDLTISRTGRKFPLR